MKKIIGFILATTLILSLSTSVFAESSKGITVTGKGIVMAQPDLATMHISIEFAEDTAVEALNAVNETSQAVLTELKNAGIEEDRIVTSYTGSYPLYDYTSDYYYDEREIIGYMSYTNIEIGTKDIENVGKYIDTAILAGATGFNGVSFSVENPEIYYSEALTLAVKKANTSAAAIANAYGKPLGNVISVVEESSSTYYQTFESDIYAEESMAKDSLENSTEIHYDEIEVRASISATYEF